MRENFVREIEHLLEAVPAEQWADWSVCGVVYEFSPWHRFSSVTLETRDDSGRGRGLGSWKNYFSAESDGTRIEGEFAEYEANNVWRTHHKLLIEAAEALLSIDFTRFGKSIIVEDGRLYGPFRVQVYDTDKNFQLNFCEFVLARRLYPLG